MSTDMIKISKNTGYTVDEISKIKNYLFFTPEFVPDCSIAQSWQRLMLNDNIKEHDLLLLKHELYEMDLKKKYPKMAHLEAHAQASYKYNYGALSEEYYGNLKKRNKNK
jgi:GTPase Era involved in 16S rRNA processing